QTCPLLLRVFTTNNGRHHRMDEFARANVPSSELQIYTWMDATLKELTSLVKEVYPEARKKGTHFSFAIVYPDPNRQGYRFGVGRLPRRLYSRKAWNIAVVSSDRLRGAIFFVFELPLCKSYLLELWESDTDIRLFFIIIVCNKLNMLYV
ncbi:Histone deacetylase complex subunit SAP18, partial [Acipenser ruthenus]